MDINVFEFFQNTKTRAHRNENKLWHAIAQHSTEAKCCRSRNVWNKVLSSLFTNFCFTATSKWNKGLPLSLSGSVNGCYIMPMALPPSAKKSRCPPVLFPLIATNKTWHYCSKCLYDTIHGSINEVEPMDLYSQRLPSSGTPWNTSVTFFLRCLQVSERIWRHAEQILSYFEWKVAQSQS